MRNEPVIEEHRHCRVLEYRNEHVGYTTQQMYLKACGIEQKLPNSFYGPCVREGYALHAVITGSGYIRVNGGKDQAVTGGQLFCVKPGEETYYSAGTDPWYYCWVTFRGETARLFIDSAGFTEGINIRNCHVDIEKFLDIAKEIIDIPQRSVSCELNRMALSYQFLSLAIESNEKIDCVANQTQQLTPNDYVKYAVNYINGNFSHIKISDVSEYIGINRTYLSKIFKQIMYMTPQEYLISIRMNRGKELLEKTDIPIKNVSEDVGYMDQLVFSKSFRKCYGISPENYRKQIRKQNEAGQG